MNNQKRILFINRTNQGSTGSIVSSLMKIGSDIGFSTYLICSSYHGEKNDNVFSVDSSFFLQQINRVGTKISGKDGFWNVSNTNKVLKLIDQIKPDIVNLHNALGYFINYPMLISGILERQIKLVITCHDCWWFTGKCPHFEYTGCYKWQTECYSCPLNKEYPKALVFDKTKNMYLEKKNLLTNKGITFVSPSSWLRSHMTNSFLKNESIIVINNGIELPDYINKFKTKDGKVKLLFAANPWVSKKGIDSVLFLINSLPKDIYHISIAGDSSAFSNVPKSNNVEFLGRQSHQNMIELFRKNDLFINPTLEDNFPTVDIESFACGTPIISYNTGGSSEIIGDCGVLVDKNDKEKLLKEILEFDFEKYSPEKCRKRAELFNERKMAESYFDLFEKELKK